MLRKAVVDTQTGEVINREGDRVRVIRKESLDAFNNKKVWGKEQFTKAYNSELRKVLPMLSKREKALLMSIAPYISYHDCHLEWSNGKDIDFNAIARISDYSRNTTKATLAELKSRDIIYEGENSQNDQWFVNPWLFSRGNTINKVLQTMFKNYKIQSKGGVRWEKLGDL